MLTRLQELEEMAATRRNPPKFAIGETVDNAADDHEVGTVIAVFPTVDGSFRYAVDTEGYGALQFSPRKN